ncbi:hypothetical protein RIF29_17240 [Crotalaria pallida]|uniref:Uncharacterized protein n=1 Tax=Crotalaria pallida TaxID=3830 RepID=A0AAN9FGP8_CROPI
MSKPSNFLQRQKSKKLMCLEDHFTRQLSNMSNEWYHGGESASVPFEWESQPGTPKVRFRENSLPPLTPPPSYHQQQNAITTKKPITNKAKIKNSSPKAKASLFQTIFPTKRGGTRKANNCVLDSPRPPPPHYHESLPPLSSSSSSSLSSLSSSSPRRRSSYSVPSSPMIHSRKGEEEEEEEEDLYDVPRSSLCFGNGWSRGCYSSMFKKVLLGDLM